MKVLKKQLLKALPLVLLFTLIFTFLPIQSTETAFAEPIPERAIPTYGKFAEEEGEHLYYHLDAIVPEEEYGFFDFYERFTGEARNLVLWVSARPFNQFANVVFSISQIFGVASIFYLDTTLTFELIDRMIDLIDDNVKDLTGISSLSFGKNGMFYPLIRISVLLVIVYAFYQLVWKRSFIQSFSELLKFVVVLTVSLLLFANFTPFLKSVNKVSTEIGQFVTNSVNTEQTFRETLWGIMIDEPYLLMQYGTADLSQIGGGSESAGIERVRELLLAEPDSEARNEILEKEINERDNYFVTAHAVVNKTSTLMVYSIANFFTMFSFMLLGLGLMFTQVWFIIMAIFAPFALLIASFPSQFNVLKRYSFELILPLLAKIGFHLIIVVVMSLTSLSNSLYDSMFADASSFQFGRVFTTAIFYTMLFLGIFILRKRISSVLSSGSEFVNQIREGMAGSTTRPAQSAVHATTTVVGGTVGGVIGGLTGVGALSGVGMGTNIGSLAGKTISGQSGGVGETAETLGRLAYQTEMIKSNKKNPQKDGNKDNASLSVVDTPNAELETEEITTTENTTPTETLRDNQEAFNSFTESLYMTDEGRDELFVELADQGLSVKDLDEKTLKNAMFMGYDKEGNPIELYPLDNTELFAERIKQRQVSQEDKIKELRNKRMDKFNNYLKKKYKLKDTELKSIRNYLDDRGIDIAKLPRSVYLEADKIVSQQLDENEELNYANVMKRVLYNKAVDYEEDKWLEERGFNSNTSSSEQMTEIKHRTEYESDRATESDPDMTE